MHDVAIGEKGKRTSNLRANDSHAHGCRAAASPGGGAQEATEVPTRDTLEDKEEGAGCTLQAEERDHVR